MTPATVKTITVPTHEDGPVTCRLYATEGLFAVHRAANGEREGTRSEADTRRGGVIRRPWDGRGVLRRPGRGVVGEGAGVTVGSPVQ